jgi:hypothetical protein
MDTTHEIRHKRFRQKGNSIFLGNVDR